MKNLLTIATIALIFNTAFAQSDAASKSLRFGLKVTPALNWYKSGDKMTEKNGIAPKFGAGLMIEIRLTNTAVLATGLQLDLDGGKVKYNNTDNDRNVVAAMVGVSTPNNIVNQHTPN